MPARRWIRDALRLLDPAAGVDRPGHVLVEAGRIVRVGDAPTPHERAGADVVDAAGLCVTPAFLDLHVHLREPGPGESETVASGTRAALAGGYATVFAMPNTDPTCDRPEIVAQVRAAAQAAGPCEVVPVSALSRGLRGRELVDLDAMAAAGAGAFSDDGAWLADEALAAEAFRWAAAHDQLVMQHCEDFGLTGPGVLHESAAAHALGVPGIPRAAEDVAVARDLALAERFGTRLHICHVSTAGAAQQLRRARAAGLKISGEVAPHHLLLTCDDALAGGPDFKMKPPLREASDTEVLLAALEDGTLEAVATDHAPHADHRKCVGWLGAPFGAIGLETAFPALYTLAVQRGALRLERLVEALTSGPARVAGRPAATLAAGAPARVTGLDLGTARRVDRQALASRSHNCPFHGRELQGWPRFVLLGGALIRPR
jgi:dihydroorotase